LRRKPEEIRLSEIKRHYGLRLRLTLTLRPQWTPELQERVSRQWTELFRDVEAALREDPQGRKA
jgi:hypothetical protein